MKTKKHTLVVLLVLILALGGALFWMNRSNTQAEEAASAAAEGNIPLSSFAAGDLEKIQYTYQGETLTLDYDSGRWTLEEDPDYHLDESACNTMVTALAALNAKRQLTAQPGEDYGLNDPAVTVTVTAAGETNTFVFGAENTVTGDLYVQKAGDDAVYAVPGNKAACFELTKADLFGSFNPAGVTVSALEKVSITTGSGTLALTAVSEPADSSASSEESDSDSASYQTVWRLDGSPETDLDSDAVQNLLSALAGYVSAQVTDANPAAYGFDAPLAAVQAETAGGTVTLQYASNADGCWMMQDGDGSVYAVDVSTVNTILQAEENLQGE